MNDLLITDRPSGARLQVRVKPRASRSAILQPTEGVLIVALAAPPVDGEANAELIRLLAAAADLPKTALSVASGSASRTKLIDFAGIDAATLKTRLLAAQHRTRRK